MIKLNLIAQDEQEERILAYLQENASETLADKINNGTPFEKDGKPLINKKLLQASQITLMKRRENLQEKCQSNDYR